MAALSVVIISMEKITPISSHKRFELSSYKMCSNHSVFFHQSMYISLENIEIEIRGEDAKHNYHITYGPGVQEHSAVNRINALVQYRFLLSRFALITLSKAGHTRQFAR